MAKRIERDPATRILNLAQQAAKYLDSVGEHKRANDVRALTRANYGYRSTVQQLHRDNMALRETIAGMKKGASHV